VLDADGDAVLEDVPLEKADARQALFSILHDISAETPAAGPLIMLLWIIDCKELYPVAVLPLGNDARVATVFFATLTFPLLQSSKSFLCPFPLSHPCHGIACL
jgi:hypothetical protein